MTDKLTDQTARGERAKVAQAELKAAIDDLHATCYETFSASDIHDDEGRKTCRLYIQVLRDIEQRFEQAIVTGEVARKELANLSKSRGKISQLLP